MAGQLESYIVGELMPMANIHSVFRLLLLVISVFRCFGVFWYFYELLKKPLDWLLSLILVAGRSGRHGFKLLAVWQFL